MQKVISKFLQSNITEKNSHQYILHYYCISTFITKRSEYAKCQIELPKQAKTDAFSCKSSLIMKYEIRVLHVRKGKLFFEPRSLSVSTLENFPSIFENFKPQKRKNATCLKKNTN